MSLSRRRQKSDGESKSGLQKGGSHIVTTLPFPASQHERTCSPAHEVKAPVYTDESTSMHVAYHAIVLDREVAPSLDTPGSSGMGNGTIGHVLISGLVLL